jgi:hypothetical protein
MIIHGFAFWKFAKPDHEHHLQVLLSLTAWFGFIYRDLKATPPNCLCGQPLVSRFMTKFTPTLSKKRA